MIMKKQNNEIKIHKIHNTLTSGRIKSTPKIIEAENIIYWWESGKIRILVHSLQERCSDTIHCVYRCLTAGADFLRLEFHTRSVL